MSTLADGAEKVKALQYALGGSLSKKAQEKPRAQLDRFVAERFKILKAEREEVAHLTASFGDRMFGHISDDGPSVQRSISEIHKLSERRLQRKIEKPRVVKVEPRFITGSSFWVKAPPYDLEWTHGPVGRGAADKLTGSYEIELISINAGLQGEGAGVGVWFYCAASDPMQRVAAHLNYFYTWWDQAWGRLSQAPANEFRTRIWVWGNTEQDWVVKSDLGPSWSDWNNGGDRGNYPDGESGTISIETVFPSRTNNWYQVWIWSLAAVFTDDNRGNNGIETSVIRFYGNVPFVVFGSLF